MKVDCIFTKGDGIINEDNFLIKDNIFGVFDGATSLNKYVDDKGKTGGFIASSIAKKIFKKNNKSLKELAIETNIEIKKEMISRGININKKINLWSTSAAVIRINENSIEWLQLGDSLVLVINKDNSYQLLVKDYDHDEKNLIKWEKLAQKKIKNIRGKLTNQIIKVREGMNINYGILNGEDQMVNFLKNGSLSLKNIKHIILFTDGLLIPKKNPRKRDNFNKFISLFLKGGLKKIKNYNKQVRKNDPYCWTYPRFKQYDDIAAISITLD